MPVRRVVDADVLLRKRQLRAEIARTRTSTRATLAALKQEKSRLTSWKTYVRRFPIASLGTFFGIGLWLAAMRPGRQISRSVATNLIQWGVASARSRILGDLLDVWTNFISGNNGHSGGDGPGSI
jgi:hypothetical protein